MESIGIQVALATSVPGIADLVNISSSLDYFELLQRGGVINKAHYNKNGVGVGITTFNMVLVAIMSNLDKARPKYFGEVYYFPFVL